LRRDGPQERWVRAFVDPVGPLELFQEEPWATVFRAPVSDGFVWLKACAERQAFEVPFTAALSARWACVTEVIAHDAERRWLLMADAGETFRTLGNPPERWLELLPMYAELQIAETTRAREHLELGVPDLRLARLPELFDELAAAALPIDDSEQRQLVALAPRFFASCQELATAGIGDSVQHDDLHMNNAYVKGGSLRILDWGDASIGHPFFSLFETFRFLVEMNGLPLDDPWFARLRDAYLEPWGGGHRDTFDLALRLGAVSRAIAWLHQRNALPVAYRLAFDDGFDTMLRLAIRGTYFLA
jgi:hypothetical protein